MRQARGTSALVQYLAIHCLGRGGCRYWTSIRLVPQRRVTRRQVDPAQVAERIERKYEAGLSRFQRARRKQLGRATVRGIRLGDVLYLLATPPLNAHPIFEQEPMKDLRDHPIHVAGHSISIRRGADGRWHGSVRISRKTFLELRAYFIDRATQWSAAKIEEELRRLPYERFEPVKWQLHRILKQVNQARRQQGLERIEPACVQVGRKPLKVFVEEDQAA